MAKKKKKEKVKRARYRPKSPIQKHEPRLCSCGEILTRISYVEELKSPRNRWRCPKCGIL